MNRYLVIAYVIGLGMLWGYALAMWLTDRALSRREREAQSTTAAPHGGTP